MSKKAKKIITGISYKKEPKKDFLGEMIVDRIRERHTSDLKESEEINVYFPGSDRACRYSTPPRYDRKYIEETSIGDVQDKVNTLKRR